MRLAILKLFGSMLVADAAIAAPPPQYTVTNLGALPGDTASYVTGINDQGQVVGYSVAPGTNDHAWIWSNGTLTPLGTIGGLYSKAQGINNLGQVVGESSSSSSGAHAFLYSGGVMQDLGDLGAAQAAPTASTMPGRSSVEVSTQAGTSVRSPIPVGR